MSNKDIQKVLPNCVRASLLAHAGALKGTLVQQEKNTEKIRKVTNEVMTGLTFLLILNATA